MFPTTYSFLHFFQQPGQVAYSQIHFAFDRTIPYPQSFNPIKGIVRIHLISYFLKETDIENSVFSSTTPNPIFYNVF